MQFQGRRAKSDLEKAQRRAGYLFVLPSFALYAVFVLAPVILTFVLSFTYYDPMAGSHWVGLENFQRFFTGDRPQSRDAFVPSLFVPSGLFPAGNHRRRLRFDRMGLFLRRRSRRHQLLP